MGPGGDPQAGPPQREMDLNAPDAQGGCDNRNFPVRKVVRKDLSLRLQCPTRAEAFNILKGVITNAVAWMDNTISELVYAREAACRGEVLEARHLKPVTACWLKYKLGVCIDDPSVWTKGTFENKTVAEVIRRLIRPRDLLANNEIAYICATCDPNDPHRICGQGANACSFPAVERFPGDTVGRCIAGSPPRTIGLCPRFWDPQRADFREEIIMHEAAHITHCDAGEDSPDEGIGVSIGFAACLAQFVVAANGKRLNPDHTPRSAVNPGEQICGFTNRCGPIPAWASRGNCAR